MTTTHYKPVPHMEQLTWLDHYSVDGKDSFTLKELAERVKADCVQQNTGFLVYEDERIVVLAAQARVDEDFSESEFSHYIAIYKVCILERAVLNKEEAGKP